MSRPESPCFVTDDERWIALSTRDARAETLFVYAVATTRVFCRPTCSTRKPKRENVRFFPSPEAALAAGYRPCRRCNPAEDPPGLRHALAIRRVCALIEEAEEPPSLGELAEQVGLSRYYLHRLFKRHLGITPKEYAAICQLRKLKSSLGRGTPIIQAIYDAGFSSTSRIYEKTAKELGMTPARFKAGASGLCIQYTVTPSPFGPLLVAMTDKGICAIEFGGTSAELGTELRARFPGACVVEGGEEFNRLVARVVHRVSPVLSDAGLPLAIRGTAFQRKVWKALQRIPRSTHDPTVVF